MASVLFVSKPICAPWNDSGKNLVRDLARGLGRHRATVMVRRGDAPEVGAAAQRAVYAPAGARSFAPGLVDQARVFAALLGDRGHALWHFFFAPNARSCRAGRLATRARRMRSVHTLSSAPRDVAALVPELFADVNVVLSRHTEARFLASGLGASRLVRIAPAIAPLSLPSAEERAALRTSFGFGRDEPVLLFPGDLEFGEGARALTRVLHGLPDVRLVLACRAKTPAAKSAEHALLDGLAPSLRARVTSLGETPRIHALLAAADVVALPSADLYAKMDYPLVLLEAMSLGRPVLVAEGSAAAELCETGGAAASAVDPEALLVTLRGLFDSAERRAQLGERGHVAVRTHYGFEAMARNYEQLYDRLV
jgi:glycosyltransferase involved in cell wall biosynthesis